MLVLNGVYRRDVAPGRLQFCLADGTVAATPHKHIVMSLTRFAGGTMYFYWT
jgi:hypothetical protein